VTADQEGAVAVVDTSGYQGDPVEVGLSLAAQRLDRYGIAFDAGHARAAVSAALGVLGELVGDEGAGPAAVEIFVEQLAVGASVRSFYGEDPLTQAEVRQALTGSQLILNSLWHFENCM
jgi:hypothetical protein